MSELPPRAAALLLSCCTPSPPTRPRLAPPFLALALTRPPACCHTASKELFASHLGGPATALDVAVCPSAAYAISTVAANVQLAAGDEVVLLEEHYASVLPWQHAAELAGAAVVAVPRALGPQAAATPSITDALLSAITPRTAVVTAAPCGWTDGAVVDLVAVGAACRAVGAALILDATQWVGAMPLELDAIQPDAVVVSVHKWLLGLYSFAFLYLAPEGAVGRTMGSQWAKAGVPIEHHDRNRVHPQAICWLCVS